MEITHSKENVKKNLAKWNNPLPDLENTDVEFCKTGKKEQLNLRDKKLDYTLYSPQNIDVEVRQWVGLFDPNKTEWVIVYGVGLGYYYAGLKNWLSGNAKRQVIFIEDDLAVLYAFMETDIAGQLLDDPQAHLLYLPEDKIRVKEFEDLIRRSLFREIYISALAAYQEKKLNAFENLSFLIQFFKGIQQSTTAEYLTLGKTFFKNFYHNLLELDNTVNGTALLEKFKGMPAIICGAGPSLGKNIEVLKTLKDKALIFAGGTAMNALNAYDFIPHFGCGIDPFSFHYSRILANIAFETPFFFRSRMTSDAVSLLHGPKVYLPGTTGYPIAEFVDKELEYAPFRMDEGANVINTTLSIAEKLGCNPIIFVGLDLAYTDGLSYAPGITSHGIHDPREQFITKAKQDELVLATDIYGQPIYTLMKWMVESSWYANFARNFPHLKLINCTEGGIGFAGIENMSLKEAAEGYLQDSIDCEGNIAEALLSKSANQSPSVEQIKEVLTKVVKDLNECAEKMTIFQQEHPDIWFEKLPKESAELAAFEAELERLPAYEYLLKSFDTAYKVYMRTPEKKEIGEQSDVQDLLKGRFPYLAEIVVKNLKYIQKAIKRKVNFEQAKKTVHEEIKVPAVPTLPQESTPSIRYYSSGKVLSSAYYKNGLKHGQFQTFTDSGQLLSSREFKEGLEDGTHVYFFPDGKLKSQIPYNQGLLDGEVRLYHSNGVLKRSITYRMGKRHGFDILNYINGTPLLKAEYQEDIPVGKAMTWHIEGPMSMEVSYFTPGVIAQIKRWDANGELQASEGPKLDFMDTAVVNSMQLQNSIADMAHGLEFLVQALNKDFSSEVKADLEHQIEGFDEEMENLKNLGSALYEASGMGAEKKEAIWKTPSNERQLDAFIQGITSPMQESMLKLQWQLRSMIEKIQKQSDEPKQD